MTSPNSKNSPQKNTQGVSDEFILKITKEITVKFIEVGRITPANFESAFNAIYGAIKDKQKG